MRLSRARLLEAQLKILLEVTRAINANVKTRKILTIYESFLKNQLNIGKLMLYNYNNAWSCLLKYGPDVDNIHIDVEKDLYDIKEYQTVNFYPQGSKQKFDIVIPVYHKEKPLAYVLLGDFSEEELGISVGIKYMNFIQTLTNIIVVAIENKKLAKENIRQAAMKKELEVASQMQNMLFPSELPNDIHLEMDAVYLPHDQVGGDYYDFIRLNENEVIFCMADVSGKGVAAALLMSNFQANLKILCSRLNSLTELVKELNAKVMASAKGEKYITLFIARYHMLTRTLSYVNAGHNPPLVVHGKNLSLLKVGCTGLGMFDELPKVKEGVISIMSPSVMLCYTDGVVELESEKGTEFGIKPLKDILTRSQTMSMKELNRSIVELLNAHRGIRPYIDDIALFSCKMN
jgi:sigma-B regulation protein RsbU (phosphoserine phosphatase)